MPKIALIQPVFTNKEIDRNIKTLYPLGLGYLAAYIPKHWEVTIIDEQVESIDFNAHFDIVGITTTTVTINRAYEIAQEFRNKGAKVVLGGVHASICPDETKPYCDSVCIGDGEEVIGQIISDYENNSLKKEYIGSFKPLKDLKMPRHDLFRHKYSFIPVSTSRGCPFNCNFCSIHRFYNGTYRTREVEDVIEELKTLPEAYDMVFFSDGNMYGYKSKDVERFKELCRRIYEEKQKGTIKFKYFMGYGSINSLDDIEALELAQKAGCAAWFVGFESINPDSLKDMNKHLNLKYGTDSYKRLVENAQKRGMMVVGEMLVGNDSDDIEVLNKTSEFLKQIDFDILRLQIVQPLPGTKLFESLKEQNRLHLKNFPEDWKKLNELMMGVLFDLKKLDPFELKKWVKETGMDFYSPQRIFMRGLKSLWKTFNPKFAATIILMNFKSRKTYANYKLTN
ncbi:MAG: B12-binding domain-containing radical SAM protein [Desulfobacterales bacterium]|nr:B12-binding domain-containing radical SAM protein [Desulfobacterales bacterium]MBF0395942.1 B12-binding domain-containing radical SAM protein [Desulfobacterales bacterium]